MWLGKEKVVQTPAQFWVGAAGSLCFNFLCSLCCGELGLPILLNM